MKKFDPVYLYYSLILFFPPVHELGHVIIAKLTNTEIYDMQWTYITVDYSSFDYLHDIWEYTMLIPAICSFLFLYMFLRDMDIHICDLKNIRFRWKIN